MKQSKLERAGQWIDRNATRILLVEAGVIAAIVIVSWKLGRFWWIQ